MKLLFLLLSSFLAGSLAWGAACCGGGFAAPSLIAGDDRGQLSTSLSFNEIVIDNVDSQGIWRRWSEHQKVQNLRLEGAHILSDRWQAGFVIPVVQRSQHNTTTSGLGDLAVSAGYEYLPDWNYSLYRPKGIGYLQLTLPTGLSRAESENGGLDSRGNGFWALGVGTLLTKSFRMWDVFTSAEVHRSFSKDVNNSVLQGRLNPGYGGNLGLGAGYNSASFRYGAAVTWSYEDPVKITGASPSAGAVERYATGVLSVSYLANDEWSGVFSYSDQTLFGDPVNTSLGRGIALQLQKRWAR